MYILAAKLGKPFDGVEVIVEDSQLHSHGSVEIDGKAATSVSYTRRMVEDKSEYDLNFRNGKEAVARIRGLSANDLVHAVGEENAKAIHQNPSARSSISGKNLATHRGTTPEAQEAAIEEGVAAELKARAEATRNPDRQAFDAVIKAREEASLAEQQGAAERTAAPLGPLVPMSAEDAAKRKAMQAAALNKQFVHVDGRYFFKDKGNKLAFEDKGNKIVTASSDARTAAGVVMMATSKGWTSLKVSGSPEFKREAWIEAAAAGLKVSGYQPEPSDMAALKQRQASLARNAVEQGREHPTDRAEKTTGKDAGTLSKDDVAELTKKRQRAEDFDQLKETGREGISKRRIVEGVATAVAEAKIHNPETLAMVRQEVRSRLDRMAPGDKVPTLHTYDRNAPSKAVQVDKVLPQVDRNVERSR